MEPFYIYLRPFIFGFLNTIKNFYDLAVYSHLDKKLLVFLLDILQDEKEFFSVSASHSNPKKPKKINKFFTEGRTSKNVLYIDSSPKT
jgi:hypothetical protein